MKVDHFEGGQARSPARWMTLADAVWWVRYRIERPAWDATLGDLDRPFEVCSVGAMRNVLMADKIGAWGRLVLAANEQPDWRNVAVPIPAVEWEWRIVADSADRFIAEPYAMIYLDRAAVMREFPAGGKRKRGRPDDFDWQAIRAMYDAEQEGLTQGRLLDLLQLRCRERWGKAPGDSRLKTKIREWRRE